MTSITVMLADDHRLVREALRDALAREADIHVVGEAGSGEEALALVPRVRPDVLVLDIGLPKMNGIEVAARLRSAGSEPRIVALSAYTDKRFVTEMLRSGANAFVAKSAAGLDLVRAIRAVMAGQTYLCPEIAGAVVSSMNQGEAPPRLGRREVEVLRLVAQGERSSEIASRLNLSVATVEVHRRNIMRKLGLRTVAELTRYAIREGMVDL
jgi:two-component system NarL family response regulator